MGANHYRFKDENGPQKQSQMPVDKSVDDYQNLAGNARKLAKQTELHKK